MKRRATKSRDDTITTANRGAYNITEENRIEDNVKGEERGAIRYDIMMQTKKINDFCCLVNVILLSDYCFGFFTM